MTGTLYAPLPPIERLRELFDYDPEMGILRWKVNPTPRQRIAGTIAGSIRGKHLNVRINNKRYIAARVAWALFHNEDPQDFCIAQKDKNVFNIAIANLEKIPEQEVKRRKGSINTKISPQNTSGTVGVTFNREQKKWRATFCCRYLGSFVTKEEAIAARKKAELELLNQSAAS